MATLRKIVTDAYRESGILQKGAALDADQLQEGLDKLLMLVDNVFGEEVGGPYVDLNYGSNEVFNSFSIGSNKQTEIDNSFAKPSYRLFVHNSEAKTVYLDPSPYDGARFSVVDAAKNFSTKPLTIVADTRSIEGQNQIVLNTDGANVSWFYRADVGNWVKLTPLNVDDEMPFPSQFDDYFIIKLATRLHPRYLVQTAQETMMHYKEMQRKFRSRYSTSEQMRSEIGLCRLSGSSRHAVSFVDGTLRFNQGIVY